MYGAVFCMLEEFIIEKYDVDMWHNIKHEAEAAVATAAATASVEAVTSEVETSDSRHIDTCDHLPKSDSSTTDEKVGCQKVSAPRKAGQHFVDVDDSDCSGNSRSSTGNPGNCGYDSIAASIDDNIDTNGRNDEFSNMIFPKDYQFLRRKYYPDEWCVQLVVHTSNITSIPVPDLLKQFGKWIIQYHFRNEHAKLLNSLGSTLRDWLSNLNPMHDYLQKIFTGTHFKPPYFWCEDDDEIGGSILLYYSSTRGTLLCPLTEGLVEELAEYHFGIKVKLELLSLQGEVRVDNRKSEYTTWRITAVETHQQYRLSSLPKQKASSDETKSETVIGVTPIDPKKLTVRCPFSGCAVNAKNILDSCAQRHDRLVFAPLRSQEEEIYVSMPLSRLQNDSISNMGIKQHQYRLPDDKDVVDLLRENSQSQSIIELLRNTNNTLKGNGAIEQKCLCHISKEEEVKTSEVLAANSGKKRSFGSMVLSRFIQPFTTAVSTVIEAISSYKSLSDVCSIKQETIPETRGNKRQKVLRDTTSAGGKEICTEMLTDSIPNDDEIGLNMATLKSLFPFHVLVDETFMIQQVGNKLLPLLQCNFQRSTNFNHHYENSNPTLLHIHLSELFDFSRPVMGQNLNWKTLQKVADQNFSLVPKMSIFSRPKPSDHRRVSIEETNTAKNGLRFIASMIKTDCRGMVLFHLTPDVKNITELHDVGLQLTDLPLHSSQRHMIYLGEYIAQEVNQAHKLDQISKHLEHERKLSNTLLYNLLPRNVADDLRRGNKVEPTHYDNVTVFFSDVVGFTSICDQVDPWQVIDLLNQLYSVMDFLASRFKLYKIETIGDAYMCCSGLPIPDMYHAENIANFSIAVMECVKQILSPVDGTPIQLRIGIHTGHCTAGVVGTLTPHFCLFGDLVNSTARHEQTSMVGKIQCSDELYQRLMYERHDESEQFIFERRGYVDMKGKGKCLTYFLEGATMYNQYCHPTALDELSEQVSVMLESRQWKRRRYFQKSGSFRSSASNSTLLSKDSTCNSSCSIVTPSMSPNSVWDMNKIMDSGFQKR